MKKDWEEKKLGDKNLLEIIDGDRGKNYPTKSDFFEEGFCLFMNTKNVTPDGLNFETTMFINESKDKALGNGKLKKNDVVMTTRGTIGNLGIYSDDVEYDNIRINSGMLIFRPNLKVIIPEYLFEILRSDIIKSQIKQHVSGAAQPQLPIKTLINFTFPVPNSISEQRAIVSKLDEAFAAIARAKENVEKNLQNARELLDSTFQAEFAIKENDWEKVQLSELIERNWIISHLDGNHGSNYPKKEEFLASGVPYISANCIKRDTVNLSEAKYLAPERAASIRKGVAKNRDVLFAHNATVGPVAVLYTEKEEIILGTSLTYYRCNLDRIFPEYLALYMRSTKFVSQYLQIMRQSTRNQIPITKQRELIHVIPPLTVQKDIATKLDALSAQTNKLEAIYQQKLVDLEELKKSILQKAFNGGES
ncbi:MAG: restriction endonuclease subunit S [Desulfitobacteriaceae bacterium]